MPENDRCMYGYEGDAKMPSWLKLQLGARRETDGFSD